MARSGLRNVVDLRGKPPRFLRNTPLPFRPPEKRTPLRARRRRARLFIVGSLLFAALVLVAVVHFASYREEVTIGKIVVAGNRRVPSEIISSYIENILHDEKFHFFSRANIFTYPKSVIERDLVIDFPRIQEARISRESLFSRDLQVSLTERSPLATWCGEANDCYLLDESGYLFAQATEAELPATDYVFKGALSATSTPIGQLFVPAHLPGILALLQLFGQSGFSASRVTIDKDQDFLVQLERGFYVKASFGEDAQTLARNLQLILSSDSLRNKESDIEYIDLRFGNRVYYKFKGEEEAESGQ